MRGKCLDLPATLRAWNNSYHENMIYFAGLIFGLECGSNEQVILGEER